MDQVNQTSGTAAEQASSFSAEEVAAGRAKDGSVTDSSPAKAGAVGADTSIATEGSAEVGVAATGSDVLVGIDGADKIAPDDDAPELKARFTDDSVTGRNLSGGNNPASTLPQTSPLLSATPPTVAKALIKAYPYLLIVNKSLAIATWTNDDYWINIIILSCFSLGVLYFEKLVVWAGHLIIVSVVILYSVLNNRILQETKARPTLDYVVQALTATSIKADMLLNPITSLSLTAYDVKRLLFTTLFLTPIYLIITFLIIKPRIILLFSGLFLLTYHSSYSRVSRRILWKIKFARLLCFYLTGLDFSQAKNHSLFAAAFAKVQSGNGSSSNSSANKPVRFTYVIYENQRRWLGIGWTSNLLSYERTAWTDEFLNESSPVEDFQLPNTSDDSNFNNPLESSSKISGASWRWVDKTWRLDLTNDGAITLTSKRSKTTANPAADEGFIYSDNTWKKPSTDDTFSKYTRRRRWIRTAELVFSNTDEEELPTLSASEAKARPVPAIPISAGVETTASGRKNDTSSVTKRKSLRFADDKDS